MNTIAPPVEAPPAPLVHATPKPRVAPVWFLTFGMAVAGAALVLFAHPQVAPEGIPWSVPWWALALGFAVAELAAVKISFGRDSHTISLSEIPLVFGLALASPIALIGGRLIGSTAILVFYRQQPPLKLAFNVALFNLETAIAIAVYRVWLGAASPNSLYGWGGILLAVTAAVFTSAAMVDAVIALHDGIRKFTELARSFATGSLISISVGFLGMVSVALVWHDRWAFFLLAGMVTIFFMLMRVYGAMSRRHDDLQAVFGFTGALSRAESTQEIAALALDECRSVLRCELADIVMFDKATGEPERLAIQADGEIHSQRMDSRTVASVRAQLSATSEPVQFGADHGEDVTRYFAGMDVDNGIVVPIERNKRLVGIIAVGNRIDPIKTFSPLDIELLESLARQFAESLERAELVEKLQDQIGANEDLIRSKDSLIATVSHEMRTPLTTVLGYAEILGEEAAADGNPARLEILKSIAGEAANLDNIVEDLLTAARDDLGSLSVEPKPTNVHEEVLAVVNGSLVPNSDVETEILPVRAYTDPQRVQQIVRNLLENARKWGGEATKVTVTSDGQYARVRVADNGDGVDSEVQPVMFAPYKPAHLQGAQPGAIGIGLTLSRRLARMMGGDLTYYRSKDWSIFELTIPIAGPARAAAS